MFPLAAGLMLSTTGCSAVMNTLHKTHEEEFADRTAAVEGWSGVEAPQWLPTDAVDIHNLATNDESNALIVLNSAKSLPKGCERATRTGIPFDTASWAPTIDKFPDTVERCGDYEVMQIHGGYMGWFAATEKGQKPTGSPTP